MGNLQQRMLSEDQEGYFKESTKGHYNLCYEQPDGSCSPDCEHYAVSDVSAMGAGSGESEEPDPSCANQEQEKNAPSTSACEQPQKRCLREGVVTRNPFLNFLRRYRLENCGLTVIEAATNGAKVWRGMSDEEKLPYVIQACQKQFKKRKTIKRCPKCKAKISRRKRLARHRRNADERRDDSYIC